MSSQQELFPSLLGKITKNQFYIWILLSSTPFHNKKTCWTLAYEQALINPFNPNSD